MKKIVVTQHEINQATRPSIQKNKKKYTRKTKHKDQSDNERSESKKAEE